MEEILSSQPATVADVANLAESIAANRFRPTSSQLHLVRWCCSLLRSLFPSLSVTAFGPNKLRQVQEAMVAHGLSRGETPLWESHVRARVSNPKRCPSDRYSTQSYARAVARARKRGSVGPLEVERAKRLAEELG